MSSIPYYLCYAIPVTLFLGLYLGSWWIGLPILLGFGVLPLVDLVVGLDESNLSKDDELKIKNKFSFRLVTLLWAPTQVAVVLVSAWYVSTQTLQWWELVLVTLSVATSCGGLGITISHELCHQKTKIEQLASQVILLFVNYSHFHLEHVYGHHHRVATPEDPATSRLGESFYSFLPRTMIGSYMSAWEWEANRVRVRKLNPWKLENRMINYLILQGLLSLSIFLAFGWVGLVFFLAQSFFSASLLEAINYIEHYGLMRKKLPNGRYEKVKPIHSWNANNFIANIIVAESGFVLIGFARNNT